MSGGFLRNTAVELLLLLIVGTLIAATARRFRVPYTLALVGAGIALGFADLPELRAFELSADLLFSFLLPALLFEAAFHLRYEDFRRNLVPILVLAVPGVLLATAVTSGLLYGALATTGLRAGFGWMHALLFGAIITATDPVSVLSLFKTLGVDRRLNTVVEGESLLNDGVAVVLFVIVAAVFGVDLHHAGDPPSLHGAGEIAVFAVRTFVWMSGGGALIGGVVGLLGSLLLRNINDHLIEVTVTTVLAYGSFLLAEVLGCSGVLSTVAAGMVVGSFGAAYGMSTRTRLAVEDFWEYAAFVSNTLVFLLVGLQMPIGQLLSDAFPVALAFLATLAGRAVAVYGALPVLAAARVALPPSWGHMLVWGGLRGGLSMVLVLGLPVGMQGRELLIHLVFGTVAASLFLQGLTIPRLTAWLGLDHEREGEVRDAERFRAELLGIRVGALALQDMEHGGQVSPAVAARIRAWYDGRERGVRDGLALVLKEREEVQAHEVLGTLVRLTDLEREAVRHANRLDSVAPDVAEVVLQGLDARTEALRHALTGRALSDAVDDVLGKATNDTTP